MLTYAEVLEKQAARHSATMELPEPNSGLFFLRLVRLPKRGRETVVDIFSAGHRFRVRVTRFLSPLRDTLFLIRRKKNMWRILKFMFRLNYLLPLWMRTIRMSGC